MPTYALTLLQIVMGSTMVAVGYHDFRSAEDAKTRGLFEQLEAVIFPNVPDETMSSFRRAAAGLLMLAGLGICVASLFG